MQRSKFRETLPSYHGGKELFDDKRFPMSLGFKFKSSFLRNSIHFLSEASMLPTLLMTTLHISRRMLRIAVR